MKRSLMTIAFIALTLTALKAEENTNVYNFGDITRIQASMVYEVHVTEGTSGRVTIVFESDYQKHIGVKYNEKKSELSLQLNDIPNKFKRGNQPAIKVYLEMDRIDAITLMGAGTVIFDGDFSGGNDLQISMSGTAKIYGLRADGKDLNINSSGACKTEVSGNFSKSVEIEHSGASKGEYNLNARELCCEMSGAAKASIQGQFDDSAEIQVSGACNLEMEGSTEHFQFEASGASYIAAKDFIAKNVRGVLSGASQADIHAVRSIVYDSSRTTKINIYGSPSVKLTTDHPFSSEIVIP